MMNTSAHPETVSLNLSDFTILMNLLEMQVNLHYKSLEDVDKLRLSESKALNQWLLEVKEAVKDSICFGDSVSQRITITSEQIRLLLNLITAIKELRDYLGLRNDYLSGFKKRLGVEEIG